MAEETQNTKAKADDSSGGGNNKLLLIITVLNFLLSIGVIAIIFINFKSKKEEQISDISVESESEAHGETKAGEHGEAKPDAHGGAAGKDAAKNEHSKDFGKYIKLDEFMVNLNTIGSVKPQFFKVNIELLVANVEIEDEVKQKMPQVRNTVIDLINSKKPVDVATVEGRDHLKEEIKNALNTFLTAGKVNEVFFTNYVL